MRVQMIQWAAVLLVAAGLARGQDGAYPGPVDEPPISYSKAAVHDPVAQLQQRIARGETTLKWDARWGWLPSLLKALDIPVSSQVLVFSKTSLQADHIGPHEPRAIYFNDSVYVGSVQNGEALEVASVDPKQGTIFYSMRDDPAGGPGFVRTTSCLSCHKINATLGVPGLLVRSVYPDSRGFPILQAGSTYTDSRSPIEERWGGWYVTGTHGDQHHMGNVFVPDGQPPESLLKLQTGQNVTDLSKFFDTSAYLRPTSDIVALMVLEHQVHGHDLLTRAQWEERWAVAQQAQMDRALGRKAGPLNDEARARLERWADRIVKYLMFVDEPYLTDHIKGTSGFREEFEKRGPFDAQGRSLRQMDLHKWMFRYPCSYMVYSEQFDALGPIVKTAVLRRMGEVLSGKSEDPAFSISATKRRAILEILRATKPELVRGMGLGVGG